MSTYVDEKLAPQPRSRGGNAQATRKQLDARYGSHEEGADRIVIESMGRREEWRRISGRSDDGAAGDMFEQVGT